MVDIKYLKCWRRYLHYVHFVYLLSAIELCTLHIRNVSSKRSMFPRVENFRYNLNLARIDVDVMMLGAQQTLTIFTLRVLAHLPANCLSCWQPQHTMFPTQFCCAFSKMKTFSVMPLSLMSPALYCYLSRHHSRSV